MTKSHNIKWADMSAVMKQYGEFSHSQYMKGMPTGIREACQRLRLLENDTHWDCTLADAVISSHPHQIRTLFSIIISTCFPSNPIDLWAKYKNDMADDILHRVRN